ncbi:MAG: M1 family metallopeptidase [Phycisphaerales bacterium]
MRLFRDPIRLRRLYAPLLAMTVIATIALSGAWNACAQRDVERLEPRHRAVEARPTGTIFSPLTLPTPNAMRSGSGAPGPEYWQQQVDYTIAASLDPTTYELNAHQVMVYHNNSPDALDYIWLHLEQNIFRADSIGSKIAANNAIGMQQAGGTGVTITNLRCGETSLKLHVYDTLARIDLPSPLEPGGTIELAFDFAFTIQPKVFRRFGIEQVEQGQIIEVAQWFPAAVVYDDVNGWNTQPYLGAGEFYTNFGSYTLELTMPREYVIVATGALQNPSDVFTTEQAERYDKAKDSRRTVMIIAPEEVGTSESRPQGDGPLTWRFTADNVRTVAWAASNAFIYDAASLDDVLIQSVYPREGLEVWKDSTQMLRTAIEGYNTRWFEYPYPVATNVNGIEGGMEYPMIIFCRARSNERSLYGVTTHEIGHNWFPMIVNTDERRHAWMDEGFNSFINYYSFGEWFPGERGRRGEAASFTRRVDGDVVPIEMAPDQLPSNLLGRLQYEKTAVGLVLLREQILGPERFDAAFRTYIRRWAFKSPRPADFFRTMEDAAGMDLAWFWRGWFLEVTTLDQAVGAVEVDVDDGRSSVEILNASSMVMPVTYTVTYEDGGEETRTLPVEVWYNTNSFRDSWASGRAIIRVEIDPEEVFPDIDRANNMWVR